MDTPMNALSQPSLAERVEEALKEEILSGRLAPAQRIDLNAYRESWSVSITPLRDAVKQLEVLGFVEVSPRRGVFVARIDGRALKQIFDLRIALECLAVGLATPAIPEQKLAEMREIYLQAQNAAHNKKRNELLRKTDSVVHNIVIEYCDNERLVNFMISLRDLIRWSQQTIIMNLNEPYETTLPEHMRIVDALCERDAEGAEKAMRLHLENSYKRVEAFLNERSAGEKTEPENVRKEA
jgi:DNA-binding GntR family transcriptional regulator